MANPVFSDDEKKMVMIALKTLERSVKVTLSRSQMPLVVDAYNKQLSVVQVLMSKVASL